MSGIDTVPGNANRRQQGCSSRTYPDERIIPIIDAYLATLPKSCPARPKLIGRDIAGKKRISPYLGKRIHELLRQRGYAPDLTDTSRESNNRLYRTDQILSA